MRRVDGTTQIYAVLGSPVHHTRSPQMQNAAFAAAGINAIYVALEVSAPRLDQALAGLHAARVMGLNLTTPHKEAAFSMVCERTKEAETARVVNALRWASNGWQGHATDGIGFLAWVRELGLNLLDKRVLMVGAGGAARAIASLITCKSLHIVSRNPAHARSLADREPWLPVVWSALDDLPGDHGGWEVMVRALSVEPISEEEERWWAGHEKNAIMLDLNYGERAADSRALAHERGIRYEDGTELLIQQGAASFEFWTGKKPSLQAMREALREAG